MVLFVWKKKTQLPLKSKMTSTTTTNTKGTEELKTTVSTSTPVELNVIKDLKGDKEKHFEELFGDDKDKHDMHKKTSQHDTHDKRDDTQNYSDNMHNDSDLYRKQL